MKSLAIPLVGILALAGAAQAAPPGLTVEGTAFVLTTGDGRVLKGRELQGATLHVAIGDDPEAAVRLDSIEPDPEDPGILRHQFKVQDAHGQWVALCEPNFSGETWGFPIALPPGHPGRDGPITLTCASGAVGKCVRFGYQPWKAGPHGERLVDYHAACVHMVRADYCGDDRPHTRNGTMIDVYDRIGVEDDAARDDRSYAFEAGWSPAGAVCVARTRWPDIVTLDGLRRHCPRLAGMTACDEDAAASHGALTFTRVRVTPRIGE